MLFFSLLIIGFSALTTAARLEDFHKDVLFRLIASMDTKALTKTVMLNKNLRAQVQTFFSLPTVDGYFTSVLAQDYQTFLGALRLYQQFNKAKPRPILLGCDANVDNLIKFYQQDYKRFVEGELDFLELLYPCSVTLFNIKFNHPGFEWTHLDVYEARKVENQFYMISTLEQVDHVIASINSKEIDRFRTLSEHSRIAPSVAGYAFLRSVERLLSERYSFVNRFIAETLLGWVVKSNDDIGAVSHSVDFDENWKTMTACTALFKNRRVGTAEEIIKECPISVICAVNNCSPLMVFRHSRRLITQLDLLAEFWEDVLQCDSIKTMASEIAMCEQIDLLIATLRGRKFEGDFVEMLQRISRGTKEKIGVSVLEGVSM